MDVKKAQPRGKPVNPTPAHTSLSQHSASQLLSQQAGTSRSHRSSATQSGSPDAHHSPSPPAQAPDKAQDPLTLPTIPADHSHSCVGCSWCSGDPYYGPPPQLRPNPSTYKGISALITSCEKYPEVWRTFPTNKFLVASDGVEFPIHHIILAAASPFFRAMFNARCLAGGNRDYLDIESPMMETILKFVYTGECEVKDSNVESLLEAAHQLKIIGIAQLCCQFIIKSLSPENCLKLYNFTKPLVCPGVRRKILLYILQHFKQVLPQAEFVDLAFEDLEALLKDDFLNVRNEELAFHALKTWIEHEPDGRLEHLRPLMKCVRFGLMNLGYFTRSVLSWKHVVAHYLNRTATKVPPSAACFDPRRLVDFGIHDPLLIRPRVPYEIIFAIGGWNAGSPTNFMETYDARADRWFLTQASEVAPRAYHGLVAVDHKIYLIGGFDGAEHFNTVRCFDPTTLTWTHKANMHFPRCYISCCVLNGMIYAIGGFNGRTRMNSVERYDPLTNQWEMCPAMVHQRSDASACSLYGRVYVAGGFNGDDVLDSVEVFDPVGNEWSFIRPMRIPRSGLAITAHQGKLHVIGGFDGVSRLSAVERYDPRVGGDWEILKDMSSLRSNFTAVELDDMIFVIGGFNGTCTIPYVECYDSERNVWADAAHLNLSRSALSACVLRGLPNARDFSYGTLVQSPDYLSLTDDEDPGNMAPCPGPSQIGQL